jgi:curved DNA-binding protein CbpA
MPGNFPDHYAALHVPRTATQREIARAYRSLLRTHHPDLANPTAAPAELQLIMQAFEVLRDPKQRLAYDREVLRNERDILRNEQRAAAAGPMDGQSKDHSREVPVRHIRHGDPPLRATPVRWESGPWATIRFDPGGKRRR